MGKRELKSRHLDQSPLFSIIASYSNLCHSNSSRRPVPRLSALCPSSHQVTKLYIYIDSTEKVNDREKLRKTWRNGPSYSRHLHQQVLGYLQLFLTPAYPCSSVPPEDSSPLVHLHQGETWALCLLCCIFSLHPVLLQPSPLSMQPYGYNSIYHKHSPSWFLSSLNSPFIASLALSFPQTDHYPLTIF